MFDIAVAGSFAIVATVVAVAVAPLAVVVAAPAAHTDVPDS